jgi:uncharacterized membrane protein YdjX (TVP38/TMEM64 family)
VHKIQYSDFFALHLRKKKALFLTGSGQDRGVMLSKSRIFFLVFIFLGVLAFYYIGGNEHLQLKNVQGKLEHIRSFYQQDPWMTLGLFSGLFIFMTSLSIPGSIVLTLLAGTIFGILPGTIIVTLSATLGASCAFIMSRYLFREAILRKFGVQFEKLDYKFKQNGKTFLLSLRLFPGSPFVVINLLMGLTTIQLWTFIWITFCGMFPGGLIFVYAGRKIAEISSPTEIITWPIILALLALGLMPLFFKWVLSFNQQRIQETSGYDHLRKIHRQR